MRGQFRMKWVVWVCFISLLVFSAFLLAKGPKKPKPKGGPTIHVSANFIGEYPGAKIVGNGTFTEDNTGGTLEINRKDGRLILGFNPGGDLEIWLDDAINQLEECYDPAWKNPFPCPEKAELPPSPIIADDFSFYTYHEVYLQDSCENGQVPGYGVGDTLNLLAMEDGEKLYVGALVRFKKAGYPDFFDLRYNKTGVLESGWYYGIVEITAFEENNNLEGVDQWLIRPLECSVSPVINLNEANVHQYVPIKRKGRPGPDNPGHVWCNHGDYIVPFELWIERLN